jgi:hypothetical protein
VADEAVSCERVSVWKLPAFTKVQGEFEKMQRGANCNQAKIGYFSMYAISELPTAYVGAQWIRTPNKVLRSKGSAFAGG